LKIDMRWIGLDTFNKKLQRMRQTMPNSSLLAMKKATEYLRGYIVKKKLSGQVLKRKTGRLAGSIQSEQYIVGGGVVGRVGSNLKYARIHETGGVITSKSAKFLYFTVDGLEVFTQKVTIPARPYIWPSFVEASSMIGKVLGEKFISSMMVEAKKVPSKIVVG